MARSALFVLWQFGGDNWYLTPSFKNISSNSFDFSLSSMYVVGGAPACLNWLCRRCHAVTIDVAVLSLIGVATIVLPS
jgi:hypothetical protein